MLDQPDKEKTWSDLLPEEVDLHYRLCAKRDDDLNALANSVWMEFCKYLFVVNAGAAAALFLLPNSNGERGYLIAFALFGLGIFSVGIAWFSGWRLSARLSGGWTRDFSALMRSQITFDELDAKHRARRRSIWSWLSRFGLVLSLLLLLAGGAVAAKTFWETSKVL